MKLQGYNETMICYVLGIGSPDHPIPASSYYEGYMNSGSILNGNEYYGYVLPMGPPYGGPLFFTQYSFLGLNPHNLQGPYVDYWEQNVNHSLINWAYCADDPKNFAGYTTDCWGLTASDGNTGYSAHSPTNDRGVLTPTAAISSMPYTPEQSMDAIHTFYYFLGDKLWGTYGFYDAFNPTSNWYADSYLAIDEGPIIIMIENYRTGLCGIFSCHARKLTSALHPWGLHIDHVWKIQVENVQNYSLRYGSVRLSRAFNLGLHAVLFPGTELRVYFYCQSPHPNHQYIIDLEIIAFPFREGLFKLSILFGHRQVGDFQDHIFQPFSTETFSPYRHQTDR